MKLTFIKRVALLSLIILPCINNLYANTESAKTLYDYCSADVNSNNAVEQQKFNLCYGVFLGGTDTYFVVRAIMKDESIFKKDCNRNIDDLINHFIVKYRKNPKHFDNDVGGFGIIIIDTLNDLCPLE